MTGVYFGEKHSAKIPWMKMSASPFKKKKKKKRPQQKKHWGMKGQCRILKQPLRKGLLCVGKILFTPKIIYQAFRNQLKGKPVTFTHSFNHWFF